MLEGAEKVPMKQGDTGVWTLTTDSLEPNLYGYSFLADSVNLVDPSNTRIKPNLLNLSNIVRGHSKTPLTWEVQDIRHGEIQGIRGNTRSSICCTASVMMSAAVG
jgi:enterochelin esterase family protein